MKWWREKWRWLKSWWQKPQSLELTFEDNPPPLNDLILDGIYKHLDFSDKKSFRLVCKTWLDSSLGLWRKESKLVINGKYGGIPVGMLYNKSEDGHQENSRFYRELEYPVLNLELALYDVGIFLQSRHLQLIQIDEIEQAQEIISKRFGHSIEHLELLGCPIVQKAELAEYFARLLRNFPKLQSLTMEPVIHFQPGSSLYDEWHSEHASSVKTLNVDLKGSEIGLDGATAILNFTPNIKKLQLKGSACEDFLKALKYPLASTGTHILLESLTINAESMLGAAIGRSYIHLKAYLDAVHPPLKTLKASVCDFRYDENGGLILTPDFMCKEVLMGVESTLTFLDLLVTASYNPWIRVLEGCTLPNLTKLFIRRSYMCNENLELKFDFGTLRGTPRLKVLHCLVDSFNNIFDRKQGIVIGFEECEVECTGEGLPLDPVFLEHLEEFRFEMYQKPTPECWRKFAGMMPNLQKVEAILDEKTLPLVLQLWPGLRQCLIIPRSKRLIKKKTIAKLQAESGDAIKIDYAAISDNDWNKWWIRRDVELVVTVKII